MICENRSVVVEFDRMDDIVVDSVGAADLWNDTQRGQDDCSRKDLGRVERSWRLIDSLAIRCDTSLIGSS